MFSAHCTSALKSDTRPCWGCQGHRLVKLHVGPTLGWPSKRNCFPLQLVGRRSYTKRSRAPHRAIVPTVMVLTESTPFEIGTKAPAFQVRMLSQVQPACQVTPLSCVTCVGFQGVAGFFDFAKGRLCTGSMMSVWMHAAL